MQFKFFSKIPGDLTLEQTINADAGRKHNGISHITNSISARQRWSINHGLRCALISKVMAESGLAVTQDVSNDLLLNRIKLSQCHIENFTSAINLQNNPFDEDAMQDVLLNISTGQAAPTEVEEFLFNIESNGEDAKKQMIQQCETDKTKFSTYVVKRVKILNFASCAKKRKINVNGKEQQVRMQGDLFGRLLGIAMFSQGQLNFDTVRNYTLLCLSY